MLTTVESPDVGELGLRESIVALERMKETCGIINAISIKSGTYLMKNSIAGMTESKGLDENNDKRYIP